MMSPFQLTGSNLDYEYIIGRLEQSSPDLVNEGLTPEIRIVTLIINLKLTLSLCNPILVSKKMSSNRTTFC
ncbi:hypothetical protein BH09BAC4_BH09BAC4_02520 [soil metagenome]